MVRSVFVFGPRVQHLVDDSVIHRLLGTHEIVPIRVLPDLFQEFIVKNLPLDECGIDFIDGLEKVLYPLGNKPCDVIIPIKQNKLQQQ